MFLLTSFLPLFSILIRPTLAGVYVTNPVAETVGKGMQSLSVEWADDGLSPFLSNISTSSVDLYTGSKTQQFWLQNLAEAVNIGQTSKVTAMVEGGIGGDGQFYFVRFTSASLMSSTKPDEPYEAFSAVFTLQGMTGSFNETVKAVLDAAGATTNTTTNAVTSSVTGSSSASGMTTSTKASSSSTGTASKSTSTNATSTHSTASSTSSSNSTSGSPTMFSPPEFRALLTGTIAVGMLLSGLALAL